MFQQTNDRNLLHWPLAFMLLWISCLSLAKGDCRKDYQQKIQQASERNVVHRAFYPTKRYRDVLMMLDEAYSGQQVHSKTWNKFLSSLNKQHEAYYGMKIDSAKFAQELVLLSNLRVMCEPKPLANKKLLQSFFALKIRAQAMLPKTTLTLPPSTPDTHTPKKLTPRIIQVSPAPIVISDEYTRDVRIAQHLSTSINDCTGRVPELQNDFTLDLSTLEDLATQVEEAADTTEEAGGEAEAAAAAVHVEGAVTQEVCPVCAEEKNIGDLFTSYNCECSGSKKVCDDCAKTFYLGSLKENSYPQSCLFCSGRLSDAELFHGRILNRSDIAKWKKRSLLHLAFSMPDFAKCDNPDCDNGFFIDTPAFTDSLASGCFACGKKPDICHQCRRTNHYPKSCDQMWDEWAQKCQTEFNAIPCPQCWEPVEHNGGCYHMTCPSSKCKCEFSIITGMPLHHPLYAYDVAGFPIQLFYDKGILTPNGRRDQNGRRIDVDGNITEQVLKRIVMDGFSVDVPTDVIVTRDRQKYVSYDPDTNQAWELDKTTFAPVREIPASQFYTFKGEWQKFILQMKAEIAEHRKAEKK